MKYTQNINIQTALPQPININPGVLHREAAIGYRLYRNP
jgi:hypothetical protein